MTAMPAIPVGPAFPASPARRVLLTGFEPFDGATSNSSWDAVSLVHERWSARGVANLSLVTARIPVTFDVSLDALIATHSPDIVIAVGLAQGRAAITPELIAINLADARIPDNAGVQPLDQPVIDGGAAAYFTGLPVKAIVDQMRGAGVGAHLSHSAGTFVCNTLMYRLMCAVDGTGIRAGFIHVPFSPTLAAGTSQPSLSIETIALGLEIAIRASAAG